MSTSLLLALSLVRSAAALTPVDAAQNRRLTEAESNIAALVSRLDTLEATVTAQQAQIEAYETVLGGLSLDEDGRMVVTGSLVVEGGNLYVQNGTGGTLATENGLGNLIIGYDEDDGNTKSGSHNLVLGPDNTYTGSGGLVSGHHNTIGSYLTYVLGGAGNTEVSGVGSVAIAGAANQVSGYHSVALGGAYSTLTGPGQVVAGGSTNTVSGDDSVVIGGQEHTVSGRVAVAVGGYGGAVTEDYGVLLGGTTPYSGDVYVESTSFNDILAGLGSAADLGDLVDRVDALELSLAGVGARMDDAEGEIVALWDAIAPITTMTISDQIADLQSEDAVLRDLIEALDSGADDLSGDVVTLMSTQPALESLLALVRAEDGDVYVSGANLYVDNGADVVTKNGKGNLIMGFTENDVAGCAHTITGSHNVVTGRCNVAAGSHGFVGGYTNTIGDDAAILSGAGNVADWGVVLAGWYNEATDYGVVGTGYGNAAGPDSVVLTGEENDAQSWGAVATGYQNLADYHAFVGGGTANTALYFGAVLNGSSNTSDLNGTVLGGYDNAATANLAVVMGGQENTGSADLALVGGGYRNSVTDPGTHATVMGGAYNTTSTAFDVVVP